LNNVDLDVLAEQLAFDTILCNGHHGWMRAGLAFGALGCGGREQEGGCSDGQKKASGMHGELTVVLGGRQ
jgi:hypothetical protein